VGRGCRQGTPVVVVVSERREEIYDVVDPRLGDQEAALVEQMA
jgi:hypothetical protein